MATIKTMASTAKKSAKIVSMAAAMAASMGLSGDDVRAAECAFADMADEYGQKALIVDLHPFHGFIA